jgi:hypothetical protein
MNRFNAITSMPWGGIFEKKKKEKKEKEKFSHRSGTSGDVDAAKVLAVE